MEDEFIEIDIDSRGNVLPPKVDKIALVDADTIAYTAALSAEEEIMVLPESFYTKEEWQEIVSDPTYNPDTGMMYSFNLYVAMQKVEDKIQRILDNTGCSEVELHFTRGKGFRYDIYPAYKGNRKDKRTPAGLQEIKNIMAAKWPAFQHDDYEADDIVVARMFEHPDKYILCAIDKDVLNSVPGRHFRYYESSFYNKDMEWVEVSEKTSILWPYLQCIVGDTSDNIIGPRGIGPKRAAKFVNEDMTELEMWQGVIAAYKSKGMTLEQAVLNMNLVNMRLLIKNEIKLWEVKDGRVSQRLTRD